MLQVLVEYRKNAPAYEENRHKRIGYEIQVKVDFDGDEKLSQVIKNIDTAITPLKDAVDQMFRLGPSWWPF